MLYINLCKQNFSGLPLCIAEPVTMQCRRQALDLLRGCAACAGVVRCQACGKALADHASLAQHLRDRHRGLNRPEAPDGGQTLSLADFVGARR